MRRLYAIDGLRGAAALVVVLHHYFGPIPILPALAVDLFFVLSGFVMARTYEARMRSGLPARAFLAIRYRRLFLPLFVGTTIGLAERLFSGFRPSSELWAAYAMSLAFMPAFWLSNAFWFNLPAWSLFLEIVCNWLHGALLWRADNRALVASLTLLVAATAVLLGYGLAHWGKGLVSIVSMLPRELGFYVAGILFFRNYGDALFAVRLSPMAQRSFAWAGALSYPLYATHHPVLRLLFAFGVPLPWTFAIALFVATLLTASFKSSLVPSARSPATLTIQPPAPEDPARRTS